MAEGVDALRKLTEFLAEGKDPVDAYTEIDRLYPNRGWDIEAHRLRTMRAVIDGSEPRRPRAALGAQVRECPKPVKREFSSADEKHEFYARLFASGVEQEGGD